MWQFEHQPTPQMQANFSIEYMLPALCAQQLKSGVADMGIVPVITTATIPDLEILPGVAIASYSPVGSITLASKDPIENVGTIAVDANSRTSVALLQVLLTKFYGGPRKLVPMSPDLPSMLKRHDAALLIGDAALTASTYGLFSYDLATLWRQHTGLPFVFAVWAIRRQAVEECDPQLPITEIFQRSRELGLRPENLASIARQWAPKLGLTGERIVSYLRDNIHYELDAECAKGLALYFHYAHECGLIPAPPTLQFLQR